MMLSEFKKHIDNNFPYLKGKKIGIAISGGIDSVVLTHLFFLLKEYTILLAHCNFHLRDKESDLDEEFVKKLGKKLNLKTHATSIKINAKGSIQLAARELRYRWFKELITANHFDYLITAHHADDNLETFLINLTRGSGLDGFTGIPEKNGSIIRPLLPFSREEITAFATKNHITWREDKSNATTKYVRNKIRHKVVPTLKEINPNLLTSFAKTISNLKESKQIVEDKISDISKEVISEKEGILKLNIAKIKKLENPKSYLFELLKKYHFTAWNDVYELLTAQSGKHVLSESHQLLKDRDFLLLTSRNFKTTQETSYYIPNNIAEITLPIHLNFKEVTNTSKKNVHTIFVDKTSLKYPLIIRKWKNGDFFFPEGMQGKKKLSKYFKDEKMSLIEKQQLWLLCSNNNDIIWVIGKRQDKRFSVKKSTNILQIVTK